MYKLIIDDRQHQIGQQLPVSINTFSIVWGGHPRVQVLPPQVQGIRLWLLEMIARTEGEYVEVQGVLVPTCELLAETS